MSAIHPTACVDKKAQIADDARIGPYCVIGPDVVIAEGCELFAHVHVAGRTSIGARTRIQPFASLGTPPQSVKYRGGPTRLIVGAECDIREGVTMNIGTEEDRGGRGVTQVGDRCFFMVGSHVGHDCVVGDGVIFANNVAVGGHVEIGDNVVFGGQAAVRQFVRIGEGAMIVGLSGVRADIIPFGMASGPLARLVGLNVVGMRRRGLAKSDVLRVRRAYRELFHGDGVFEDRLERVARDHQEDPLVGRIVEFIRAGEARPLTTAAPENGGGEAP